MRFLKGVLIAEIFILWVEFFYKFGMSFNPKGFFIAMPLYFLYLWALHLFFGLIKNRRGFWLLGIVLSRRAGLFMEWFLVGNSPWQKPAVFQSAQFLFHGAYPILGWLLVNTPVPKLRRNRLAYYMVGGSGMTAFGFFFGDSNLRKLWFLFLPLVVFVGLYYFIYQLRTVQAQDSPAEQMARGII